jgi:hypothetical protein
LQGGELFHFEVQELTDSPCRVTAHLKVFVIAPPVRAKFLSMIMAMTAAAFALLFFVIYILFSITK